MNKKNTSTPVGILQTVYNRLTLERKVRSAPPIKNGIAAIHNGRSGSTVLSKFIHKHKSIMWDDEALESYYQGKLPDQKYFKDPLQAVKWRAKIASRTDRIYGFETKALKYQHLSDKLVNCDIETYIHKLKKIGFDRYLVLKRENYLRYIISIAVGKSRGGFHQRKNETKKETRVRLSPSSIQVWNYRVPLLELFEALDDLYDSLKEILKHSDHLWLTYEEDIEQNPQKAYLKFCEWTKISPISSDTELKKINTAKAKDIVENYQEIEDTLKGTKYEWMLNS